MAPLGRAFVGSDVYLGAQEAAALVGRWGEGVGYGREVRGAGGRGGYDREPAQGRFGGRGRFEGNREQRYEARHPQAQRGGGFNFWNAVNPVTPFRQLGNAFGGGHHHHHHHHRMQREEWLRANPGGDWEEREGRRQQWEIDHPGQPFVGSDASVGEFMGALIDSASALGIMPRAALVDAAPANMLVREPLPMSTGTAPVGIGLTAQITSRPQRIGFRPERLFVSSFSLDGLGAAAWTINDITIGNVSQLAQAGNLPGDMFANIAIDSFVTFKTAQTAMDVVLVTTYNGTTEGGIPFTGSIIGSSAAVG